MDLLAGVAALALVGLYLYTRRSRRPEPGPLAATPTAVADFSPEGLRAVAQAHPRRPAQGYLTTLADGTPVAFGYTPGHDRVDVFAPQGDDASAFGAYEFSLASMQWLSDPPPSAEEIRPVLRDTFPG